MAIERINIISDDPIDVSYDAPQSIRVIDDSEVRVVRVVENVEAVDHIGVFSDNPSIISDNVPPIIKIIDESEIKVVKIIESGPQGRPGTSGIITNGAFTGSFSGSFVGNGSGLTDIVSASYALSASYAPGALIDGATYNITSSWAISASYVSSQYYATFSQPSLATTWSFNHNLNYKYPIITVWNTEDEVIIPEKIFAASTSQSIVYFPVPVSGYASATVGSILPTSTGSTGGSATLPSNVVSSSLQFFTITAPFTGSFTGSFTGDGSGLFGVTATLPSNIVSSSTQITYSGISSIPSGIVSSSLQFSNITSPFTGSFKGDGSGLTGITATLPSNIVSSSAQITYSGITGAPSNLISSSFQIASDISGSFNNASSSFSNRVTTLETKTVYSGSFSGSFVGNGSGLTNIVSASYALSASYSPGGSPVQTIGARIQTEDSYITAGSKGYRHINSNSTIIKTRTISTITGSIDINIRRNGTTLGNVSLVNQTGSIDTTLSGWTTTLYRDDLLEFYVSGSSTYITDIILFIDIIT